MCAGTKPDVGQETKSEPLYTAAAPPAMQASRACRAPGPRAASVCARPPPHARFAARSHAIAPPRAPAMPRPACAAAVTRTDAVILRLQTRLAQIARPYSTQPINPALGRTSHSPYPHPRSPASALGNVNTPPKDPDHWPPTMSFPVPWWILTFALLYVRGPCAL